MSRIKDQCGVATDRPPDSRMNGDFPKTKSILWDRSGIGKPLYLHLGYFRKPRVCIPEKVLKLVQHQCENYGKNSHNLIGTLVVDDDGEGVQFQVDRLDVRPMLSADAPACLAPGDLLIPLEVTNNTAGKRRGTVGDFVKALKRLQERCCSKSGIELSSFVLLRGWASFYSNAHSSVAHMDFDLVTMGTVFKVTPIAKIPIVLTALSKNLAGPRSLSHTQGVPKSGYLTMDQARKLLLVLESDPKAGTLPIVGIWISGLDFIQHTFVWAACLRYIHNTHLQDRVCTPPEEFLLVLYSPLNSKPEFYQCCTTTGDAEFKYELWCGHEVDNHTKSLSAQSDHFTTVELNQEQTGEEKSIFEAALAKHITESSSSQRDNNFNDDLSPRSLPTPHSESLPVIKPMVPDVSILWTDSPNNSSTHQSHPPMPQPISTGATPHYSTNKIPRPVNPPSPYQTNITSSNVTRLPNYFVPNRSERDNVPFHSNAGFESVQYASPYVSHPNQTSPFPVEAASNSSGLSNHHMSLSSSYNRNTSNNAISGFQNLDQSQYHTQNQAAFQLNQPPSSHPGGYHLYSYPVPNHPQPHHSPQTVLFNGTPQQMVLSTQGNNTCLTSQSTIDLNKQQHMSEKQNLCHGTASPTGLLLNHHAAPVIASHFPTSHTMANTTNSQQLSWTANAAHTPAARNQHGPITIMKTVVEESLPSTSCGKCNCHCSSQENAYGNSEERVAVQAEADHSINRSNHNTTGNNTKSSDDDSGLSVTPDRPNPSPTPKAQREDSNAGNENGSVTANSLGPINNVNWEQVPPEIRALLIQQNEQLKLLQQQIQMLMVNAQQPQTSAANSSSSSLPVPSLDSNARTRQMCSVAVNTSFSDDKSLVQSYPDHSAEGNQSSSQPSSLQISQSCRPRDGPEMSSNANDSSDSKGSRRSQSESLNTLEAPENRCTSSSEPLNVEAWTNFEKGVVENSENQSSYSGKDSRSLISEEPVSDFDPHRYQFDPSDLHENDFYNCQDESYSTVAEDATDPRQFYDQLMNNIQMFLSNGEDDCTEGADKTDQASLALHESVTRVPDSANSSLFPHINYMSMMLGAGSDTGQSMEINAMAMKYLKDDQLTQMAMMLKNNDGDTQTTNKVLQRMIATGGGKKSSTEISQLGMSLNNMTMGTRDYLEKHGLLGNESQYLNDYSSLDHSLKLKTDFSLAMTDRDVDRSVGMLKSPQKNCRQTEFRHLKSHLPTSPLVTDETDNLWQENDFKVKKAPKDLGASPVLVPAKHYNVTQSPLQQETRNNSRKGRGNIFDNCSVDSTDNENILDIAKLKQLPKLL